MSEELTTEEIAWVENALIYWQPILAQEWTIGFDPNDRPISDDTCRAELGRSSDYLLATLRFRPPHTWSMDSEDWPLRYEVEEVVVHELGHCIMHDLQHTHNLVHAHFSRDAWAVQNSHFVHHMERAIERWSRCLVATRYGFDVIKGPKR